MNTFIVYHLRVRELEKWNTVEEAISPFLCQNLSNLCDWSRAMSRMRKRECQFLWMAERTLRDTRSTSAILLLNPQQEMISPGEEGWNRGENGANFRSTVHGKLGPFTKRSSEKRIAPIRVLLQTSSPHSGFDLFQFITTPFHSAFNRCDASAD